MITAESLSGIATFVAVARSSSFTEAGEVLGISKSAVGKAIARLEERLGVKLFHRTTRRLSLSADGEAYYAVCAAALDEIGEVEGSLGTRLAEPAGRLRVDMPAAFGRRVVLPNSELHVYEDEEQGDHFLMFKNPLKFTKELRVFLER